MQRASFVPASKIFLMAVAAVLLIIAAMSLTAASAQTNSLGVDHNGGSPDINFGPALVANGGTTTISIVADPPPAGLGAWTVNVFFDPAVVTPKVCTAFGDSGSCNLAFAGNALRFSGFQVAGVFGVTDTADITFEGVGATGDCSTITPEAVTWNDPDANNLVRPAVSLGQICIGDVATGSPSPVPSLTPTPEPTGSPTPTPEPTGTPTAEPTKSPPTDTPTPTPTRSPETDTPTPTPTEPGGPTPTPTVTPDFTCDGLPATIVGTNHRDFLVGTHGDDVIVALGGRDIVYGNGGNDVICLGSGDDVAVGGWGNDRIFGEDGNDAIYGGFGADYLDGGDGFDFCFGGFGHDTVVNCGPGFGWGWH